MEHRKLFLVLAAIACLAPVAKSQAPKAVTIADLKDMLVEDAYISGGFPEKNATKEKREAIALERKANTRAIVEIFTHSLPPARKNAKRADILFPESLLLDACIFNERKSNTVFSHIDRTCTQAGQVILASTLAEGTSDLTVLEQRANMVREFISKEDLRKNTRSFMRSFAKHETDLLTRWASSEAASINHTIANATGKNKNKVLEAIANAWNYARWTTVQYVGSSALLAAAGVTGYNVYSNFNKAARGKALADLLAGGATTAATLWMAKNVYQYGKTGNIKDLEEKALVTKSVNGFNELVTLVQKITNELNEHAKKESLPASFKTVTDMRDVVVELKKTLAETLKKGDFFGTSLLLSNNVDRISTLLLFVGEIDAYLSMARHYRALQKTRNTTGERVTVDFCTFNTTSTTPYIRAEGYWNPIIPTKIVCTNNLELGGTTPSRNAVITGPNAGGKSFGLRGLLVQLMLSHSYKMAWARKFETTPFKLVIGQLSNVDDTAEGHSRLMSEVFNMRSIIQRINKLSPAKGEFAFVVTDELFTGTEVDIAVKISLEMAQVFAELKHVMYILATHYKKLTQLEEITQGVFKNYHVEAYITEADTGNEVTYPFKWFYGPGKINVALDIMLLQMKNYEMESDVFYERLRALQARIKKAEAAEGTTAPVTAPVRLS